MDPLGKISREFLKQQRAKELKTATVLAKGLKSEGMKTEHVEEMLYANGFDADVIDEAMSMLSGRKK